MLSAAVVIGAFRVKSQCSHPLCHRDQCYTELQMRVVTEDNSKIIFLISQGKHVMTPH